jgi:transposase
VVRGPAACSCCGTDLDDAAVVGVQKRQVFEAQPAPPPKVTEYQVVAKACPGCGAVTEGVAPADVTGRVQYGPLVHAQAALAVCAHYLPVARAARLLATLTGTRVSVGFVAGVRGRAAGRLGPFMNRVRALLRGAGVLYADETPARAAGHLPGCAAAVSGAWPTPRSVGTVWMTVRRTGDRITNAHPFRPPLPH